MTIQHSPLAVTDQLVFMYDMYNQPKSYLGAPTKNEILNVSWGGDGSAQSIIPFGSTLVTNPLLQYKGATTYLWGPGTIPNSYINGPVNLMSTANTSTSWTFSCMVRREDRLPIAALDVYMYFPSSDGTAPGTVVDMGNGWYLVYRTRTGAANYLSLVGLANFAANVRYYLSGAMVEKTTVPSTFIPNTSTRTATASLLDITGNNTITMGSLTYAADNTFSFNAAGNYIALPTSIGYTTAVSAFAMVKTSGTSRGGYHIVCGPANLEISIPTGGGLRTGVGTSDGRFVSTHGSPVDDGNWHYVGLTFDGTTKTTYIDGVAVGTFPVTGTFNGVVSNRALGIFGVGDATYGMNGLIATYAVYSKSLSAAEVTQNFYAIRRRFGL